jgi:hypothetical protein
MARRGWLSGHLTCRAGSRGMSRASPWKALERKRRRSSGPSPSPVPGTSWCCCHPSTRPAPAVGCERAFATRDSARSSPRRCILQWVMPFQIAGLSSVYATEKETFQTLLCSCIQVQGWLLSVAGVAWELDSATRTRAVRRFAQLTMSKEIHVPRKSFAAATSSEFLPVDCRWT